MHNGTFGSIDKFRMLKIMSEQINLLDEKKKNYISTFITEFNTLTKKINAIADERLRIYVANLVFGDYSLRTDELLNKDYDKEIVTRLKNYIYAKVLIIKKPAIEHLRNAKRLKDRENSLKKLKNG